MVTLQLAVGGYCFHDFRRDFHGLGGIGHTVAEELSNLLLELVIRNVEASTSHPGNEQLLRRQYEGVKGECRNVP
jgi:hypothetical protein